MSANAPKPTKKRLIRVKKPAKMRIIHVAVSSIDFDFGEPNEMSEEEMDEITNEYIGIYKIETNNPDDCLAEVLDVVSDKSGWGIDALKYKVIDKKNHKQGLTPDELHRYYFYL